MPLAQMLPGFAVDGALIYVAMLMMSSLRGLDWDDLTEYAPAVCTTIMMAFTFSIANGIAFGFIRKISDINPLDPRPCGKITQQIPIPSGDVGIHSRP